MAKKENESVSDSKTPEVVEDTAPAMDETVEQTSETSETLDAEDIDNTLMLLNLMDQEIGGKGEIAGIPDELSGSLKYLVEKLVFVRELFEDPLWKSILDDMADQKEDGQTPSVEVAIARNIPLEKLQFIAENEDYEGAQSELTSNLAAKKQAEDDEAGYEASFEESKKALDEYASGMGYDEERKNQLAQVGLDLFQILADGVITAAEWERVDKMDNYDKDMADVIGQIPTDDAKEVLPDKASVEAAAASNTQAKTKKPTQATGPGLGSMGAYQNVTTDYTKTGSRNRRG